MTGPEEIVAALTAMIADEVGDRLFRGDGEDGLPAARDWRQTGPGTAEFWLTDGSHVVVTVERVRS